MQINTNLHIAKTGGTSHEKSKLDIQYVTYLRYLSSPLASSLIRDAAR